MLTGTEKTSAPEPGSQHRVQFYERDPFLLDAISAMLRTGFEHGETVVVIGTSSHINSIDNILKNGGLDVESIAGDGRYVRMNAAETMAKFAVKGRADPVLFDIIIGEAIRRAGRASHNGHVHAFGEMVALSIARGERDLTIATEELWNDLLARTRLSLCCAYPLDLFSRAEDTEIFEQVCAHHSQVLPTETYTVLSDIDEKLRTISRLQHKAALAASETARRERAEQELRLRQQELATMQIELSAGAEELLIAERRRSEFVAALGHELRNPLSAVNNALAAARDEGQRERALEIARRQTVNLGHLVNQLLDISRVAGGRVELKPERIALSSLLEEAVRGMEPRFAQSRHDVVMSIAPCCREVEIDADPARVREVIGHLVGNAIRFTPSGGRIEVRLDRCDSEVILAVRDSGIGIADDLLPRIFDPLVQGESPSDRPRGGLGTGLTMVKALVEAHGGRVGVRSGGTGKGSEFEAVFPIPAESARSGRATRQETGSARVLVVEDNLDAAESLAMVLEMDGHNVRVVNDGFSALDAAQTNEFDVFLVDIGLPGIDGYEVARRLRQMPQCARSRIVALTGYGRADDRRTALSAGFDYHLTKPVEADRLEALLLRILRS